jgi:hypothetical protein
VTPPARESWTFRITPLPSTVPAVHRVRSALKVLRRVFRLRCVAYLELPEESHQHASAASGSPSTVRSSSSPSEAS